VCQSGSLRNLKLEYTRLAVDCMQLAGDVYSPAFQSQFVRMVRAWLIPVQTGKAPTTMTLAKRGRAHGDSGQEEGRLIIEEESTE